MKRIYLEPLTKPSFAAEVYQSIFSEVENAIERGEQGIDITIGAIANNQPEDVNQFILSLPAQSIVMDGEYSVWSIFYSVAIDGIYIAIDFEGINMNNFDQIKALFCGLE